MTAESVNELIIFARLPAVGKNKTRLIPAFGEVGATAIYRHLVAHTLAQVARVHAEESVAVSIYYTGGTANEMRTELGRLLGKALGGALNFYPQVDGDLGIKMAAALDEAFKRGRKRVAIIGTDAPDLQARHLQAAFRKLETCDVVLGPADDGGYYLIGMSQLHSALFSEIHWSTEQVFPQTLNRISASRLRYQTLQCLSDVDYPEDVLCLKGSSDCKKVGDELWGAVPSRLSVIIPTLNEAKNLLRTLSSVGRPEERLEIVVADGGSNDETCQIARDWGCRIIEVKKRGRAAQQNAAAAIATGEYLLFLHADTRLPADYFEACMAIRSQGAVAGAFRLQIDDPARKYRWLERLVEWRSRWLKLPYGDQALLVESALFYRLRGFQKLDIMEDYEFVRRVQRHGPLKLMSSSVVTSARRWQKKGVLRTTCINQLCVLAYHLGIPNRKIANWYRSSR